MTKSKTRDRDTGSVLPARSEASRLSRRIGAAVRQAVPVGTPCGSQFLITVDQYPDGDRRFTTAFTPPTGRPLRGVGRTVVEAVEALAAQFAPKRRRKRAGVGTDPMEHHRWTLGIACAICREARIRTTDAAHRDVEGTAVLELAKCAARFDPVRYAGVPFRKWAKRYITKECRREVERLRSGGTFHTSTRPDRPQKVGHLDPERLSDGGGVLMADRRGE